MAVESLSISKLPERTQLLLFALIILGLGYGSLSWLITPIQSEVEELQGDISALRSEKLRGEVEKGRLPALKEDIRQSEKNSVSCARFFLSRKKQQTSLVKSTGWQWNPT